MALVCMLHYIKGELAIKLDGIVVVEAGGIGYEINVPASSSAYLAKEGDMITLYLHMAVREDDVSLYGFSSNKELQFFKKLITINGVGAKAALSILSALPLSECIKAIAFEDVTAFTRANGIGKKIAQRIVLELKDKMKEFESMTGIDFTTGEVFDSNTDVISSVGTNNDYAKREEAISALMALGYSRSEAAGAISKVKEQDLSAEDYIKKALKELF